jgi:hypothetical protein
MVQDFLRASAAAMGATMRIKQDQEQSAKMADQSHIDQTIDLLEEKITLLSNVDRYFERERQRLQVEEKDLLVQKAQLAQGVILVVTAAEGEGGGGVGPQDGDGDDGDRGQGFM